MNEIASSAEKSLLAMPICGGIRAFRVSVAKNGAKKIPITFAIGINIFS